MDKSKIQVTMTMDEFQSLNSAKTELLDALELIVQACSSQECMCCYDEHGTYTCVLCNAKSILVKYKKD